MISAYVSTTGFGIFYYLVDAKIIAISAFTAFALFVVYGIFSYFTSNIVTLFRFSIITAHAAFTAQILFTGGILSPSIAEYIIPPLLAFFYRPIRDRYYFMAFSAISVIAIWILTIQGYTENLLSANHQVVHSVIVTFFVFTIVCIYTILFRSTLANKNRQLSETISDLQATSEKLLHAEKMASLGVMSAGVAHEINNPLNFIKGGLEGLRLKLKKTKDTEQFLNAIDEGVNRASSIVNSLGHFSRETTAMNEPCFVHEILDNCLVMLQHKLKYKIEVTKKYSVQKLRLVGNEGKLHQAFLNIIANAEQAIDQRGSIQIETRAKKNLIIVSITDTGSGISQENLSKISDPFFTTKPVGRGTGLGLSITYKIVHEHNGKIEVKSEVNKGTTFTVLFKVDKPA